MKRLPLLLILVTAYSIAQVANDRQSDPLQQLQKAFPDTVELKNHGKLLEVCPDGTCDGFVTSGDVPVPALKDFAYLYVFFFSDNVTLDDWKRTEDAKKTVERVLAQNQYLSCANADSLEAARCVLRDLSRGGRIRLISVRYDEGERHTIRKPVGSIGKRAGTKSLSAPQLAIGVGIVVTHDPLLGPGRALVNTSGSYRR